MPLDLAAARCGSLDRLATRGGVALTALPPASRFVLRGRPGAIEAAGGTFGGALPQQACRAAVVGARAMLWLGPDEWLLLAPEFEGGALTAALEQAMNGQPHSLVDVSHRQTGLEISGPDAAAALNVGCPLDLEPEAFPVGMCTRTVLAKAEIVLWRTAPMTFRIEVWRSFAAFVGRFLEEASREFWISGRGVELMSRPTWSAGES
jgi:sarcosine oxidase subunit gamma